MQLTAVSVAIKVSDGANTSTAVAALRHRGSSYYGSLDP